MKKNVFGRKFKRDVNERKALFKSLMSELVLHGRINTTEQKAKSIRSSAEKLVKKAQKEANLAKKLLSSDLIPEAMEKMMKDIAPKLVNRNGGYTRIIRLGKRFNDDASMVLLEWVEGVGQVVKGQKTEKTQKQAKAPKTEKGTEVVEGEIVTEKPKKEKTVKKEEKMEVKTRKESKKTK
jgi:large subunit ribosomal protein L17